MRRAPTRRRQPTHRGAKRFGLVLTDGIVDPGGRATQAINQLADYASHLANVRVLPIAGHGRGKCARLALPSRRRSRGAQ